MPDPRLQLTTQELIYAASALRAEAYRAKAQAEVYDALADKLARIGELVQR